MIPRSGDGGAPAEKSGFKRHAVRSQNRKQIAPNRSLLRARFVCVYTWRLFLSGGLYFSDYPPSFISPAICIRKVERYICASIAVLSQVSPPPRIAVFLCGFFQPVKYLFTGRTLYLLLGPRWASEASPEAALAPRTGAVDDADESKILVIRFENVVLYGFCAALLRFPGRSRLGASWRCWPLVCVSFASSLQLRLILPRFPVGAAGPSPPPPPTPFPPPSRFLRLPPGSFCVCCLSVWRASFV